jgi:hypothetical protein
MNVLPVVAATITDLAQGEEDMVSHEEMVRGLTSRPELDALLDHLSEGDPSSKPREWWASSFLQWFSHRFSRGISEWQDRFERELIDGCWAYRPRRDGPEQGR